MVLAVDPAGAAAPEAWAGWFFPEEFTA